MHTPDEAAKLWCPMVRIARQENTSIEPLHKNAPEDVIVGGCNTDALGRTRVPHSCLCIADKCAMWRWTPKLETVKPGFFSLSGFPKFKLATPTHGYCGLAGRHGTNL